MVFPSQCRGLHPDANGNGEYDVGFALSSDVNSVGLSSGRLAISYGESFDSSASVKDLAGFDPTVSTEFGAGGVSISPSGWDLHFGPGAGASYSVKATSVYSLRHGKWFGMNDE